MIDIYQQYEWLHDCLELQVGRLRVLEQQPPYDQYGLEWFSFQNDRARRYLDITEALYLAVALDLPELVSYFTENLPPFDESVTVVLSNVDAPHCFSNSLLKICEVVETHESEILGEAYYRLLKHPIVQSHLPMTEIFSQLLIQINFTDISRFGGLSRVIDEMAEALGDREKVLYWLAADTGMLFATNQTIDIMLADWQLDDAVVDEYCADMLKNYLADEPEEALEVFLEENPFLLANLQRAVDGNVAMVMTLDYLASFGHCDGFDRDPEFKKLLSFYAYLKESGATDEQKQTIIMSAKCRDRFKEGGRDTIEVLHTLSRAEGGDHSV